MNKGKSQSLPDYKKPPVIEVVCGISFETIEKFRGPHLGLFWQKVRNKFPLCEHAQRLELPPPEFDLKNYLPRTWFINEDKNMLIQLQNNKFFFNWRRIQQEEAYPRYKTIIIAFKTNLGIFNKFLEEENLGSVNPIKCELTYINHIPKGEGWDSLGDISGVFRDLAWSSSERFLNPPIGFGGQVLFALPDDNGRLNVTLQHGERNIDKHPMLILQITATGLGADKSNDALWKWFEIAHEWIVRGFADLTGATIQENIWERMDIKSVKE
ncbi:hypothetical protein D1AOALGA4SA_6124 [Olavius algarvensis Delta 1 endosymbiont]|nr:hypothetical protein D1AOALGA4SA_6124 [Olavius algarvensis Delta 1 endosymbiont]